MQVLQDGGAVVVVTRAVAVPDCRCTQRALTIDAGASRRQGSGGGDTGGGVCEAPGAGKAAAAVLAAHPHQARSSGSPLPGRWWPLQNHAGQVAPPPQCQ